MKNETTGYRIKQLRKAEGLTQAKLAAEFRIKQDDISRYENDKSELSISMLKAYRERYHVSTDYLLGLTDTPTSDNDIIFICDYTGLNEKAINSLHDYKTSFSFIDFLERWNDISLKDGFTGEDIIDTEKQSVTFDKADVVNSLFIELSKNKTAFFKQFAQSVHDYHIAIKTSIHLMNEYLPVLKTRVQQLKDDSSMDYLLPEDEKALIINKLDMPMRYSRYDLQDLSNNFINGYFSKEIAEYNKLSAEYTPLYNEMIELQRNNGKGGKNGNNTETE